MLRLKPRSGETTILIIETDDIITRVSPILAGNRQSPSIVRCTGQLINLLADDSGDGEEPEINDRRAIRLMATRILNCRYHRQMYAALPNNLRS